MFSFFIYLGGKTPDPSAKGRGYADIMGEIHVRNAKVRFLLLENQFWKITYYFLD